MKEKITTGSGNVFADLGFSAEEAVVLGVRSQLMCDRRTRLIAKCRPPKSCALAQSRVSDLVRGKWDKFSLDMLI
jgi:predicted XRE-type DNA-binding protein